MQFSPEHLDLCARDTSATQDWYMKTLDGEVIFTDGRTPAMFLLRMPAGFVMEIYSADSTLKETGNNKLAGWSHLAFRVASIEAAKAELEKRGVRFTEEIKPA